MASGKPIIASDIGGIPENIENLENGILIKPKEENIAETVVDLWNDKALMDKISKNNLVRAKRYDWEKVVQRYIDLYNNILTSRHE